MKVIFGSEVIMLHFLPNRDEKFEGFPILILVPRLRCHPPQSRLIYLKDSWYLHVYLYVSLYPSLKSWKPSKVYFRPVGEHIIQ